MSALNDLIDYAAKLSGYVWHAQSYAQAGQTDRALQILAEADGIRKARDTALATRILPNPVNQHTGD